MIKMQEIGGDLFVADSKYYHIHEGMILVNREIAKEILNEVDITSNNISKEILDSNINRYFSEKICNLRSIKINGKREFILLRYPTLTQKSFKLLFINLNYFYNSLREYINLTLNLTKSDNLKLSYLSYKSINECAMFYDNKDKPNRVLDYTMILNSTNIKIIHNIEESTIQLDSMLLEQIHNIIVKNLKFKKLDDKTYEINLLTVKNAREIYDTVIKRLSILEQKIISYYVLSPLIKTGMKRIHDNTTTTEDDLVEALFLNMILYQKDLDVRKETIKISDKLNLTRSRNVEVPRWVVEEVIVNSGDPYPLIDLFKTKNIQFKIDPTRWEEYKRRAV